MNENSTQPTISNHNYYGNATDYYLKFTNTAGLLTQSLLNTVDHEIVDSANGSTVPYTSVLFDASEWTEAFTASR